MGKKIETPYDELTYKCTARMDQGCGKTPTSAARKPITRKKVCISRRSLEWKRILPPKDVSEHQTNRQWLWVPDWLREEE